MKPLYACCGFSYVMLAKANVAPVNIGNEFFSVCQSCNEWEEDWNRLCIFNFTLPWAFKIIFLIKRAKEIPSSVTGFLHALQQRFCPLSLSNIGQFSPWFITLQFLDRELMSTVAKSIQLIVLINVAVCRVLLNLIYVTDWHKCNQKSCQITSAAICFV